MQPANELLLPAALISQWEDVLREGGVIAEVSDRVKTEGKRIKVEFQLVILSRGTTKCFWDRAARGDRVALLFINSSNADEEALNQEVVRLLVGHGAVKGVYRYPERD